MVGTVLVHGEPNRARPGRPAAPDRTLFARRRAGSRCDDVDSDLPPAPQLDAAGNLSFRFGGRLIVTGDADGQYRGDLPITVEYQ